MRLQTRLNSHTNQALVGLLLAAVSLGLAAELPLPDLWSCETSSESELFSSTEPSIDFLQSRADLPGVGPCAFGTPASVARFEPAPAPPVFTPPSFLRQRLISLHPIHGPPDSLSA
jgi:hypothetical protein